jgi:hypothetical protein
MFAGAINVLVEYDPDAEEILVSAVAVLLRGE